MKHLIAATLLFGAACTALCAPVAAEEAMLHQQILPLNCVFEEVNDGLGTLRYLTPSECGQVVTPPPVGGTNNSTGSTRTPSQSSNGRPIRRSTFIAQPHPPIVPAEQGLLLNSISASAAESGLTFIVRPGSMLFYRPLDNSQATIRTITIGHIAANAIDFTVEPLDMTFQAESRHAVSFDKLKDSKPAVRFKVLSINTKRPEATINIRLLKSKISNNPPSSSSETTLRPIIVLAALLLLIVISAAYDKWRSARQ